MVSKTQKHLFKIFSYGGVYEQFDNIIHIIHECKSFILLLFLLPFMSSVLMSLF